MSDRNRSGDAKEPCRVAWRRLPQTCQAPRSGLRGPSIRDFLRKFFGVLDPAGDQLLRGKEANQFSLLIGLGHGFGKPSGVAVTQFLYGVDPDLAQQRGV